MISTRNLVQVRTHAQKYFQKLQKNSTNKSAYAECKKKFKESTKLRVKEEVVVKQGSNLPLSSQSPLIIAPKIEIAVPKTEPSLEKSMFARVSSLDSSITDSFGSFLFGE